jgi:UDP-N-acetylmuramoyl-L-alanyl-D-glutamate--2,6-diaminopimelate ligase
MKEFIYRWKRYYHFVRTGLLGGLISQWRYGNPQRKLKIICLTGTDGKTTTSTLVYRLLHEAGMKVALISTVGAYIGNEEIDTGFHVTSPHPRDLYKLMAKMVKRKMEYLVLEVTSQGAFQWRTWGIKPVVTGLTNVEPEHLDYHLTLENYLKAKALILNASKMSVINDDMACFNALKRSLKKKTELVIFSKNSRFSAGLEKVIRGRFKEDYNRLNAYLAVTMVKKLGLGDKDLAAGILNFELPRGRMQFVPTTLDMRLIVDFAHTGQGLEAALSSIKKNHVAKGKKLIAIYGCAGLRDRQKRPGMGRTGVTYADIVIFTAEDPRLENVWSIINQMKSNLAPYHNKVISIPNRARALRYGLESYGREGNTIAIFGKGHEQSMNYDGKSEIAWNDITEGKKILRRLETKYGREHPAC